jgi:hypothetical protein
MILTRLENESRLQTLSRAMLGIIIQVFVLYFILKHKIVETYLLIGLILSFGYWLWLGHYLLDVLKTGKSYYCITSKRFKKNQEFKLGFRSGLPAIIAFFLDCIMITFFNLAFWPAVQISLLPVLKARMAMVRSKTDIMTNIQHSSYPTTKSNKQITHNMHPHKFCAGMTIDDLTILEDAEQGFFPQIFRVTRKGADEILLLHTLPAEVLENKKVIEIFEAAINVLASFHHPNIVNIRKTGRHLGIPYYLTSLPDRTLLDLIQKHPDGLPDEQALKQFTLVLDALKYAHKHRICHGDLHPGKIWFFKDQICVADFATSWAIRKPKRKVFCNGKFGSPIHLSDQQRETGIATIQSDIHQAGCLLFFLLKGRNPYQRSNNFEAGQTLPDELEPPEHFYKPSGASYLTHLDIIIWRAIETKYQNGPIQSIQDFQTAIKDFENLKAALIHNDTDIRE